MVVSRAMKARLVYPQSAVPTPLDFGLTPEHFREVVERGEALRNNATELDAPTRGGSDAYFERVLGLREIAVPLGWKYENHRGFCRVFAPDDGPVAIAMRPGDASTGLVQHRPQLARVMGAVSLAAVRRNNAGLQQPLLPGGAVVMALTWFLLTRRDGDMVSFELSLPASITDNGWVHGWEQRIIFDQINLSEALKDDDNLDDDEESIDVDVELR